MSRLMLVLMPNIKNHFLFRVFGTFNHALVSVLFGRNDRQLYMIRTLCLLKGPCFVLQYFVVFLVHLSAWEERAGCFIFAVF